MFIDVSTILNFLSPFMGDRKDFAPTELALVFVRVGYKHSTATRLSEGLSRCGFIRTVALRFELRSSQVVRC